MLPALSTTSLEDSPHHWINWCRLCAKDDKHHNICFLYPNEHLYNENKRLSIQEALAKYFSLQTSLDDNLPKMICTNCLSLVSSMISFNERVERVQLMFSNLAETQNSSNSLDLKSVRLNFDVTESDSWFSKNSLSYMEKNYSKFNAQIKQESLERTAPMDCGASVDQDTDMEKEEIVFDGNINDAFVEEGEDPFKCNDKKEKSSDDDEQEKSIQSPLHKMEANFAKSKLDRSKKKRRKKIKQFSAADCKKKKSVVKDLKIEATCKECGQQFSKYIIYREHMQQKHNHIRSEKHWPCPVCDKVLLSLYNLERHVRIHVPLEVRQTVKCPECDNLYTSNAQLETHIRYKHKNEKPFICEECGLCLRTNSNLRQHMLIHTDIKPFECDVCKKKFKVKTRLKTHMDIHSPNKHVCNICGLQLNSRATLNRHFLVHSDEMQHKCDYCGKAFKRAKALKNHLLLHTGLKPYSCDFCERTFANGSNCRSHMKKMHPDELALLEASGNKTHTKNIPKLETLKAVTKAADNLTPVVTKFSGCFAFGKKPKHLDTNDTKQSQKSQQKLKKPTPTKQDIENIANASTSSTPLDLQYVPLVGNSTNSNCLHDIKNLENGVSTRFTTTTPIPNFDNIYQHLLKQNQTDLQIKRALTQISSQSTASNVSTPPHHDSFQDDIVAQSVRPSSQCGDDLLHSPESHHSSTTSLTPGDNLNTSLLQGAFYGSMRPSLPPANFM